MTDEYGFSGLYRFTVPLRRDDEKKVLEVCADTEVDAERIALIIADDEDYVIWDNADGETKLDGPVEAKHCDPDPQLACM